VLHTREDVLHTRARARTHARTHARADTHMMRSSHIHTYTHSHTTHTHTHTTHNTHTHIHTNTTHTHDEVVVSSLVVANKYACIGAVEDENRGSAQPIYVYGYVCL